MEIALTIIVLLAVGLGCMYTGSYIAELICDTSPQRIESDHKETDQLTNEPVEIHVDLEDVIKGYNQSLTVSSWKGGGGSGYGGTGGSGMRINVGNDAFVKYSNQVNKMIADTVKSSGVPTDET